MENVYLFSWLTAKRMTIHNSKNRSNTDCINKQILSTSITYLYTRVFIILQTNEFTLLIFEILAIIISTVASVKSYKTNQRLLQQNFDQSHYSMSNWVAKP